MSVLFFNSLSLSQWNGDESKCSLGYMTGDMRDVNMYTDRNREKRYFNCRIEDNILID
jgi:hypothetical protein